MLYLAEWGLEQDPEFHESDSFSAPAQAGPVARPTAFCAGCLDEMPGETNATALLHSALSPGNSVAPTVRKFE